MDFALASAIVSIAYTLTKMVPELIKLYQEQKAAALVNMHDAALLNAQRDIVIPAREAQKNTAKLSLETQKAALEYAVEALPAEYSSRLAPSEVRALLTKRLEALKSGHVIDRSTDLMKGPAL